MPSRPQNGPKGDKSGKKDDGQKSGDNGDMAESNKDKQRAERTSAGEGLKKAGEQIAKASGPAGDGQSSTLPDNGETGPSQEDDSLIPDDEQQTQQPPPMEQGDYANQTMQGASEALQTAGEAVANAESDEELAAAEAALADARIAIIMAEEELETLSKDPEYNEDDALDEMQVALETANSVLVIATQAVLNARTGQPNFPSNMPDGMPEEGILVTGNGELASLEDELEGSLEIFDAKMKTAREGVIAHTPAPTTGSSPDLGGDSGIGPESATSGEPGLASIPETEQSPAPGTEDADEVLASAQLPEDIPSAQGDDIVAQQLREAAIAESDPKLKAKLWQEYKRYRAGL